MPSESVTVETLEEQWTPTTIHTTFLLRPPPSSLDLDKIFVDYPLPNIGWTFTLSLTPELEKLKTPAGKKGRPGASSRTIPSGNWIPAAFSLRRGPSAIRWGDTSLFAQLSLAPLPDAASQDPAPAVCQDVASVVGDIRLPELPPAGELICAEAPVSPNNMENKVTPLATINADLADPSSLELPLRISYIISSLQPTRLKLTVTISKCPLPNGLFSARLSHVNETHYQTQSVTGGASSECLLGQSITTGRLFDVKFLTASARSSGTTKKPLLTHASLSILTEHVDPSSSILGKDWLCTLEALDDPNVEHMEEIPCPEGHEYDELDSDFDDEDEYEVPSMLSDSGGEHDRAVPRDHQSGRGNDSKKSSSSMSSFAMQEANDRDLTSLHESFKDPEKLSSNHERAIRLKFAAHRTWHAFLWYCYTGKLEFCTLKSQIEPGGRRLRLTPLGGGPPACSPKSMYRLADLVGDQDLKSKALDAIKERMFEANVLDEAFSLFTSRYSDVRKVQLAVLKKHRRSPKVKKAFLGAMKEYIKMSHAEPVLSAFYDGLVV